MNGTRPPNGLPPPIEAVCHIANSCLTFDIRITSEASEEDSAEIDTPPARQDLLNCHNCHLDTSYGPVGFRSVVIGAAGVSGLVLILVNIISLYSKPDNPGLAIAMLFAGAILLTGAVHELRNNMGSTEVDITGLRWVNTE